MSVVFPDGFRLELLSSDHRRVLFQSGELAVDDWLRTKALQHQQKNLSVTKVLADAKHQIAGFYTLATGQVDFSQLPPDIVRKLPRRALPIAILAWLGVNTIYQGQRLGTRLFAQALRDSFEAGKTFAFVGILIDCLNPEAKFFYQRWDFQELPGDPFRLFLSRAQLDAMCGDRK